MGTIQNRIFESSCADMKELPDNSVDLIFTSPPYESRKKYDTPDGDLGRLREGAFLDALKPILSECQRVLKPTGSFFLNFQGQYIDGRFTLTEAKLPVMAVEECGLGYVQNLYWTKTRPRPDNYNRRLKNRNELIYHFVKSIDDYVVHKDAVREPSRHRGHDSTCPLCNSLVKGKMDKRAWKYNPKGRDPGNVIFMKGATGQGTGDTWGGKSMGKARSNVHPALMPQGLADFFVKYGSSEGQLVLDPFMGSGTTGIAAALLGRDYVGYELSPKYAEQARLRCQQAQEHWLQSQRKAS